MSSLLSSFALGPAWARAAGDQPETKRKTFPTGDDRPPRSNDREGGDRRRDGQGNSGGSGRREFQGGNRNYNDRREAPPRQEEAGPALGVRVTIAPDAKAVHLIGKEVHQVARVYPLFDVAKILLTEKSRCRAIFEVAEPQAPLIRGKLDECVFLTREEANAHLWKSELKNTLIEEETIEVDPPTGSFQAIARCGISGEWLGPVNFHSYQTNLRRLHRERFARMPFELYATKVRTERGEEAVNAWLETMKTKTHWRLKGSEEEAWIEDRSEAERVLSARCFDKVFEESRSVNVSGAIPAKNLSPSLLTSLKLSGSHARNHPAILIPAVCRAIENEHLPVFKRQGKLHTGPARPHPLPVGAILAERPSIMVEWIRANKPAKLEGLWKAVLPEGSTAPSADFAADLFWLLHQGHILLFTDDTLVVQEAREATAPETGDAPKKAKKKKKKSKAKAPGAAPNADADAVANGAETPTEPTEEVTSEVPNEADAPVIAEAETAPSIAVSETESEPEAKTEIPAVSESTESPTETSEDAETDKIIAETEKS